MPIIWLHLWLRVNLDFTETSIVITRVKKSALILHKTKSPHYFNIVQNYNIENGCVTKRRVMMQRVFPGFFFIDAKTDIDFRDIIMAVLISREKRMTLVGPQARACCSACNGKRWPRAELFSVVSEEDRCHMRCLSCMMHVRLVGYTKKEKQQLDMNVCVQTNESKAPLCLWEDDWWGRDLPPVSLSLWADPAFESCGARPRHTDGLQSLFLSLPSHSFIICLLLPLQFR